MSSWTVDSTGTGEVAWLAPTVDDDVSSCPFSGHVEIALSGAGPSKRFSQCAPVADFVQYYFGAALHNGNATGQGCEQGECDVNWFDSAGCTGTQLGSSTGGGDTIQWLNSDWSTSYINGPQTPPANAVSARVSCYISEGTSDGNTCYMHFDKLLLSTSNSY